MKAGEVFRKTMPFVWVKLLLGLATVLISVVVFAILMGIAFLIPSLSTILFVIWIGATGVVNFILNHYIGYLVKAGHIAVITEAVTTGKVPDNQVEYGKQIVKERFLTSNIYFLLDKLVSGAVRQLQRVVEKVGGLFNAIPGMKMVTNAASMFVGIALGYIDECCLGYTFLHKDQSAFKSAADGVVIYWQNWKKLLKDAAKTTALVIVFTLAVALVLFAIFAGVVKLLNPGNSLILVGVFLVAVFAAWAVKNAFIDSYILVRMMTSYMEVAPSTQITFDLYNKLCGISGKFKELFNKGQQESPTPALAAAGTRKVRAEIPAAGKTVFCGECGAKNKAGTKFCGECGKKL